MKILEQLTTEELNRLSASLRLQINGELLGSSPIKLTNYFNEENGKKLFWTNQVRSVSQLQLELTSLKLAVNQMAKSSKQLAFILDEAEVLSMNIFGISNDLFMKTLYQEITTSINYNLNFIKNQLSDNKLENIIFSLVQDSERCYVISNNLSIDEIGFDHQMQIIDFVLKHTFETNLKAVPSKLLDINRQNFMQPAQIIIKAIQDNYKYKNIDYDNDIVKVIDSQNNIKYFSDGKEITTGFKEFPAILADQLLSIDLSLVKYVNGAKLREAKTKIILQEFTDESEIIFPTYIKDSKFYTRATNQEYVYWKIVNGIITEVTEVYPLMVVGDGKNSLQKLLNDKDISQKQIAYNTNVIDVPNRGQSILLSPKKALNNPLKYDVKNKIDQTYFNKMDDLIKKFNLKSGVVVSSMNNYYTPFDPSHADLLEIIRIID